MNKFIFGIVVTLLSASILISKVFAEDSHDHDTSEEHSDEAEHADHDDEGEHGHAENEEHSDEGEHEEEGGAKVGADKGITENGEKGFKLSKEATAAFNLKFENFIGTENSLPKSVVVSIKNGQYVYRQRDQWIKRVPVKVIKLGNDVVRLTGNDLKNGDQIITSGTGFIRGAELILSEGATHSH